MKRLVVTADDFGLTTGVVEGIVEAHVAGVVTATSLMVQGRAVDEAFRATRARPTLAVGLHFVLSFGEPVGPRDPLGSLVGPDGRFRRLDSGAHAAASVEQVRAELRAQLVRFEAGVGRPPTHIDGHHHVHALPGILPAVAEEARRLRIPVRSPDESTRLTLRRQGVRTSDAFVDGFYGAGNVSVERLGALLEGLEDGSSELMCHPAREDDVLSSISSYAGPRLEELRTLTAAGVKKKMDELEIELAHEV